jgi:succinate dehydrogenase / fumarate reductase flavoprotein subunit
MSVYLDFRDAIRRDGEDKIRSKYGNLFQMYERISGENPYRVPMRIYPAVHYTMGGLWVDYNLETTIPGLFALGEANFSDHGANRLGASALMQGLADGYFVIPATVAAHLAGRALPKVTSEHPAFVEAEAASKAQIDRLLSIKGKRPVDWIHRQLGLVMWNHCGMARNAKGLQTAIGQIRDLKQQFWSEVAVTGASRDVNMELEKAGRVADFLEFAELFAQDALVREESCGGHFREEYQTAEGEALRDDERFCHAAAWQFQGDGRPATRHTEALDFEYVKLTQRSYK